LQPTNTLLSGYSAAHAAFRQRCTARSGDKLDCGRCGSIGEKRMLRE
jgi:hypothetical protein